MKQNQSEQEIPAGLNKAKIIFHFISIIFLIESLLLYLGLIFGVVYYGMDISNKLMEIMIFVIGATVLVLNMFTYKVFSEGKFLFIILSCIIAFIGFYYLLEDEFKILL